ncbi:MAG: ATP-binding protein [Verrucomicrobiota bacterium]
MKRPRSIRARLITLYAVTLALIFAGFGGYSYFGLKQYMLASLRQGFARRAHQIASTILTEIPAKGPGWVGSEIQARFAPELNERVVRVTTPDGRVLYASRNVAALGRPLAVTFTDGNVETPAVHRREFSASGEPLQVVAIGYRLSNGDRYVVEVAGPEDVSNALAGMLMTLSLGFPVLLVLSSAGAYVLLGRALRPVDEIVSSAERITLQNLSQRLPVPQTGDEVERLSLALNRMIQRLDESYQVSSRFAADASHELRTPLTILRGELEALLKDGRLREEEAAQVESILEEAERLTQIVEGLLTLSRLDAGATQMNRDPVDLSHLVRTTVEQMAPLAEDNALTLTCQAEANVMVEANEVRLRQVVVNLVDNAIKYTPEGGRITVRVTGLPAEAVLEVADNGIGIPAAALPHVFERFYRADPALARRTRGTGLGLSMVQSILEAHRGTITVQSRENAGSTFRVHLPRLVLTVLR